MTAKFLRPFRLDLLVVGLQGVRFLPLPKVQLDIICVSVLRNYADERGVTGRESFGQSVAGRFAGILSWRLRVTPQRLRTNSRSDRPRGGGAATGLKRTSPPSRSPRTSVNAHDRLLTHVGA
jgi:hypothetical protein